MITPYSISALFYIASYATFPLCASASALDPELMRQAAHAKYSQAHSLGEGYQFAARDGWTTLNLTDVAQRHARSTSLIDNHSGQFGGVAEPLVDVEGAVLGQATHSGSNLKPRCDGHEDPSPPKAKTTTKAKAVAKPKTNAAASKTAIDGLGNVGGAVSGAVGKVDVGDVNSILKGVGAQEPVTITWYTGQDLENPSCWSKPTWAPSDSSFAAALTLEGWSSKPKCFSFLELCNGPKTCVFVRVVDACAGCAADSKHVDLTRAAFGTLADFDEGVLTVQMRMATDPADAWFEDLWGPKS